MRSWVWLAAVACSPDHPNRSTGGPPPPAPDTGSPIAAPPVLVAATCSLQAENVLRADCTLSVSPPAAVEVSFAPTQGDIAPRLSQSEALSAEHSLTAYGMVADTEYAWTARPTGHPESKIRGTWRTGSLPTNADISFLTTGSSTSPDDLAFLFNCGLNPQAVVADAAGRIVWYQALDKGLPGKRLNAQALTFTPERTFLATLARGVVREYDLSGHLLLDLQLEEGDFDRPVHHDLFRRGDYTYVLNAHTGEYGDGDVYVTDGVYVFDRSGVQQALFDLDSVLTPGGGGFPGGYWSETFPLDAIDYSHGNGIFVDEEGMMYLSFYHLDTILKVDGDPTRSSFGSVELVFQGSPLSPFDRSDVVLTSSLGVTTDLTFEAQHCPSFLSDGRFMLFDNERSGSSRVLTMRLDEAAGTADIDGSYSMNATCAFEGGALEMSNGNLLGTCAPARRFNEFEPGNPTAIRTVSPICAVPFGFAILPRGIPIRL